MTISLRATVLAFFVSIALFSTRETGMGAKADSKIAVRIETASVIMKGDRIVINVVGMGRTDAMVRGGGQLLPRGQKHAPNKDGLLEYDLYYVPPRAYLGDKLKAVKASLVETNVPPGVKGVRIYAEFNERNAMLPERKVRGRKPKEGFTATEEEQAARKKEQTITTERPKPKKEEVAAQTEEQPKKSGWNLNPFHRKPKPVPTPQPTPTVVRSKKPEAARKKQEVTRAPVPRIEESAVARETPAPETRKKSRGWSLNPFHRKRAEPEVNPAPPPAKKPEPTTVKKTEPVPKKEEAAPKREEPKKKKKWRDLNPLNWNPFKHESADPAPER